ncbi:1-(5-phosphoribosyl)-5-[(5-phosphoribosylamino)methylideneamino] imidazole-4-carboxamide isomerase [Andreesenia angusta]|uniref:1-(5-phosphoribosyl)-5-[(5-phosphoribosylamino)methylideneamino] imidazole-4-carboxamide isomerase n=1 Tax=Andreesenia angusta TaxID=39480 RepID=A0A1S1V938_9FIRM|nr:1-(5-phosphoribosyl)-5-[(5-phosphoribosylamino)methylideneamino]imidazole-4-carboxamide isomerase [Andreesenia angusta]OHW62249.1 1-(5-phosphoribosyl)-5-[(5-phosphoribosylamino)methylideneamino] imidazole-4-carboxamide isomerase [Andreesenia angusta]
MIIFPAIDIKDGNCVRLKQGKFEDMDVYFDNPVEVAKTWEAKGAEFIHIVDLDGAKDGKSKNFEIISEIARTVNIPIQVGGGIRTREAVQTLLDAGVNRVILGTAAVNEKELLKSLVDEYGKQIVVSIDAKDGIVAIDGWVNLSSLNSVDFVKELEEIGVQTIVYTDIAKDGMMEGPNFEIYRELMEKNSIDIIASGGVSTLEDVAKLSEMDMYGAIIGKALYIENIKLEDALEV